MPIERTDRLELQKILQIGQIDVGNETLFSKRDKLQVSRDHLTLVISSGGSGAAAIREAVRTAKQKLVPDYSTYMKFIMIDSDGKEVTRTTNVIGRSDIEILNISTPGAPERLRHENRGDFFKKFVPEQYDYSKLGPDGAGKDRMTGKIKFYDNAESGNTNDVKFRNIIKSIFSEDWSDKNNLPVDIMILAGLSGGNGSGTFEEIAVHAREACRTAGASAVRVFGYLFLPDTMEAIFRNNQDDLNAIYSNGYAALKELESYMSIPASPGRSEKFFSRDGVTIECNNDKRLFDYPVLISGTYDESKSMMAESIINLSIESDATFSQSSFYSNSAKNRAAYLNGNSLTIGGMLKGDVFPEDSRRYCGIGYAYAAIPDQIVTANVVSNVCQKLYKGSEETQTGETAICFCTEENRMSKSEMETQVTLYDLLGYIAQNFKETYNQEAMQSLTYEEFEQVTSMAKLLKSSGLQNADVQTENIKALVDAIIAKLEFQERTDPEVAEDDWKQDTMNYNLYFWVEPEYFEGTEWIYTIKYSSEERPANLLPFSYQGRKIRGYCPECNKPVLDGSGKYEHFLVGFLGAQSAGKTSLFVSMINDLPNYFGKLGIELPEVLCDGKYEKVKNAIEFNKKGWAVGKTDAKATIETYNASLLVKKKQGGRSIILSFIDIAGELCYDQTIGSVSLEALQKFPLIVSCHMYMLCTCVSQKGYGEADEDAAEIDNLALMQIANGIYEQRKNKDTVPPMCIVITKVDMASGDMQSQSMDSTDNPFDRANMPELNGRSTKKGDAFDLLEQMKYLKDIYATVSNKDILESLNWCKTTYENNKYMTYIAIISCSALGMPGRKYVQEKYDFENDGDHFRPMHLSKIWSWILCNIGMMPVCENYYLSYIPSFGEGFHMEDERNQEYPVRRVFEEKEEENRTKAVYKLYLNPSQADRDLYLYHMDEPTGLDKFLKRHKKRRLDILNNIGKTRNS